MQMAGIGLLAIPAFATDAGNRNKKIKRPPYLQPGNTIGITCPAGFSLLETIQPSIDLIQSWGFKVQLGTTIGKMDHTFGGTDAERVADFQQMMDDPNINAILCATGGYGAVRMVDLLNFQSFKQNPKWVIGFSDITVLHSHLHQVVHVASLHSKMCGSFPKEWANADEVQQASILSIKDALEGKKISYPSMPVEHNRIGSAKGLLVGGNLKILENLNGSASMINTDGKILFVEDVGEPLYNIDRMFCNLFRSGKLAKLSGLIVGGFSNIKVDNPAVPFGRDIYTIVKEKVAAFNYPVCFDFPVGHIKNNFALKCGLPHQLIVENNQVQLTEI